MTKYVYMRVGPNGVLPLDPAEFEDQLAGLEEEGYEYDEDSGEIPLVEFTEMGVTIYDEDSMSYMVRIELPAEKVGRGG